MVDWVLRKDIHSLLLLTCEGGECDKCHNKDVAQSSEFYTKKLK